MNTIASCEFGSKTGINEFFHLTPAQAQKRGIEAEFLRPLLKSAGESDFIRIDTKSLERCVFVCRETKEQLAKAKKTGALSHIQWGETQTFSSGPLRGMTWPNGIEVRNRQPGWYALPEYRARPARVFITKAYHDRHLQRYSNETLIADQRLYFLVPTPGISDELLAAVLNSSVTTLCTEVAGRVTLGDGVLELSVDDARDYLLVPDVRGVSAKQRKSITDAFATLCQRPIGNVFDEVKQSDRKALDRAVLSAIGLDPKQYLQPIYDGLCELVSERIELGRQRGNARKTKARKVIAEREIFTQVLDEALPEGPSRFPDDFFSAAAAAEEKTAVELPTGELTLNTDPFAMGVYTRTGGCIRHIKAPAEGKFLIYAQQAGHITALLPAKLVEVTRTVANYESYLRDLRKRLYDSYYRRSLNVGVAARLTQASWDQLHLPSIDT